MADGLKLRMGAADHCLVVVLLPINEGRSLAKMWPANAEGGPSASAKNTQLISLGLLPRSFPRDHNVLP